MLTIICTNPACYGIASHTKQFSTSDCGQCSACLNAENHPLIVCHTIRHQPVFCSMPAYPPKSCAYTYCLRTWGPVEAKLSWPQTTSSMMYQLTKSSHHFYLNGMFSLPPIPIIPMHVNVFSIPDEGCSKKSLN